MDLELQRRVYAEEIEATANLQTVGLVDALATVPRVPECWLHGNGFCLSA